MYGGGGAEKETIFEEGSAASPAVGMYVWYSVKAVS